MNRPIQDEFSKLKISRQAKYQLRRARDHKCVICGQPAQAGTRCNKHRRVERERRRKAAGSKKRYSSLSYRLEAGA